jgi:hypothetical protein
MVQDMHSFLSEYFTVVLVLYVNRGRATQVELSQGPTE